MELKVNIENNTVMHLIIFHKIHMMQVFMFFFIKKRPHFGSDLFSTKKCIVCPRSFVHLRSIWKNAQDFLDIHPQNNFFIFSLSRCLFFNKKNGSIFSNIKKCIQKNRIHALTRSSLIYIYRINNHTNLLT